MSNSINTAYVLEYEEVNGSLRIPISAPPRKDRKITFRVLAKTHSILEEMAKTSGMPLSEFMNQVSLQYVNHVVTLRDAAEYYYKRSPEERSRIIEHEKSIPPPARYFHIALLSYPDEENFILKGDNE
jgi:hypothetical protein